MVRQRMVLNLGVLFISIGALIGVAWWFFGLSSPASTPGGASGQQADGAEAAQEEQAPGIIEGIVYEVQSDLPVAGANIYAYSSDGNHETQADENGHFRLELENRQYLLVAESPGTRNAGRDDRGLPVYVNSGVHLHDVQVFVYKPATVRGLVTAFGRPAEALVTVHFDMDHSGAQNYDEAQQETEADGQFKISGLPPGKASLYVEASGYAPYESEAADLWVGDEVDFGEIPLRRGASLRGSVSDADTGDPIADAEVEVVRHARGLLMDQADDEGHFWLYGVQGQSAQVRVRAPGYGELIQRVALVAGEEQLLALTLSRSRGLVVRVLRPGGALFNGVEVRIWEEGQPPLFDGVFTGDDLVLEAEGGPYFIHAKDPENQTELTVEAWAGEVVEVVLSEGGVLRGDIFRPDSTPATKAQVRLLAQEGAAEHEIFGWTSTEEGAFELPGLAAGSYVVEYREEGFSTGRSQPTALEPGGSLGLSLRLSEGGQLQGSVVNEETGEPVIARIMITGETGENQRVTCDDSGHFEFRGLVKGRSTLVLSAQGYRTSQLSGFQVEEGKTLDVGALVLSPSANPSMEIVGIGMELSLVDGEVIIQRPLPGSASERAGLQKGDAILAVDGIGSEAIGFRGVLESIRGEEGSQVRLRVRRGGQIFEVAVQREKIVVE